MRNDVLAVGTSLTAGELREALEGIDDGAPVYLEDVYGGRYFFVGALGEDLALYIKTEEAICEDSDD